MQIKTLTKDFAFYGVLDILQKSIGIILIPIYTRVLDQSEYGNLDMIFIFTSILCILVDLQFVAGFTRLYYEQIKIGKGKEFVGTVIVSRLIGGTTIPSLFILLGYLGLIEFSFIPSFSKYSSIWIISAISVPISLTLDILLLQLRMLRLKKWFTIGTLSSTILSAIISIIFVITFKLGILGVVSGLTIGKLISITILLLRRNNEISLNFNFSIFKELIKYTFPLIPGWWLAFASSYLCRFFVFDKLGPEQNAILAISMKISTVVALLGSSFIFAWQPLAIKSIGQQGDKLFYRRSLRLFIAGGLFVLLVLTAFIQPMLTLLAPNTYNNARFYFPLFAIGSLISSCALSLNLGNEIAKKTYWMTISTITAIVINFLILIIFLDKFGIFAAGLGWVFSYTVQCIILYYTSQANFEIPYEKKAFFLLGLGCIFIILVEYLTYNQLIHNYLFTVSLLFGAIILAALVLGKEERKSIYNGVRSIIKVTPKF